MDTSTEKPEDLHTDERLPYERPELLDAGKISDVTLSNGNNSGSDSTYS